MMETNSIQLIFVYAIFSLSAVWAGPAEADNQLKGHITNIDGVHCKFTQSTVTENYFHSLDASTGTLVFDDTNCMSADNVAYEVNTMMIGNFVSRPYSHADAAFQTRQDELRSGSMLQQRGQCIQSQTYPNMGVVIDFIVSEGRITEVKHAISVQGCNANP